MERPRERFGASYVADVLTGSKSARVRENGHDTLPAYGSGRGSGRSAGAGEPGFRQKRRDPPGHRSVAPPPQLQFSDESLYKSVVQRLYW
ncbi:RQC domain-containing protein [Methanoculleus sp.]|uniref:RQC domain-containing protein n=1 Tax=Methanoculleus sp. TaxID=90427 RepID=UPI003450C348